jgi:hypothetical protein
MICTDASYNSYWRSEGGGVHLVRWLYLSELFILHKFASCNVAENWLKVTINTNTSYVIDLSVFLVKEIVVMSFKLFIWSTLGLVYFSIRGMFPIDVSSHVISCGTVALLRWWCFLIGADHRNIIRTIRATVPHLTHY